MHSLSAATSRVENSATVCRPVSLCWSILTLFIVVKLWRHNFQLFVAVNLWRHNFQLFVAVKLWRHNFQQFVAVNLWRHNFLSKNLKPRKLKILSCIFLCQMSNVCRTTFLRRYLINILSFLIHFFKPITSPLMFLVAFRTPSNESTIRYYECRLNV